MLKITKQCCRRQTAVHVHDGGAPRALIVMFEPECLVLSLKQCRAKFRIPWGQLYTRAALDAADANRLQRRRPIRRGLLRTV